MKSILYSLVLVASVACNSQPTESQNEPCDVKYPDVDGDGFGDGQIPIEICDAAADTEGLVDNGDDCDDLDVLINPDGEEVCDLAGFDEDCDGFANDLDPDFVGGVETWADLDDDGYGDPGSALMLYCDVPPNRSARADDCNDESPTTFPDAGYRELDPGCMTDADGDGYGDDREGENPVPGALAGRDCDDTEPGVYPLAKEKLDDGIDQDCDDVDDWFLFDDFDDEWGPRPDVIASLNNTELSTDFAHSGSTSVRMGAFTNLLLREVDTSPPTEEKRGCANLTWSMWVKRGPEALGPEDTLSLQAYDGDKYDDVFVLEGNGIVDEDFVFYRGLLQNERAYHPDFRMRLRASAFANDEFVYVDDIALTCTGPDKDGDGVGANQDCDDSDPRHWFDCGVCVDADDDGYGSGCDLGPDCDDDNAKLNPAADDLTPNGVDENCDVCDGPCVFDDFEDCSVDDEVWAVTSGTWDYQTTQTRSGDCGLLTAGGSEGETVVLNMSSCTTIGWSIWVKRGPNNPEIGDELTVQWSDGQAWNSAFTLAGGSDPDLVRYRGTIDDPLALWVGFKARLTGSGDIFDNWFIEDFGVGCDPTDADGDGFWDGIEDCDAQDPNQWIDCSAE